MRSWYSKRVSILLLRSTMHVCILSSRVLLWYIHSFSYSREYAFFELVLLLVLCILYIVERVCIISIRARNNIIMYYAHHVLLLLLLYGLVFILATLVRE